MTLEIDAIASIRDLVHCGSGYAILSRHALAGLTGKARFGVARIVRPSIRSEIVIAMSNQRPLTQLARRTIDLVKSEMASSAALR